MYEGIKSMFMFMESVGLIDVVLPLLLAFAVLYGIFQKTMVLGTEHGQPKKRINAIVAMIIALLVVISINLVNLMTHIIWVFSVLIVMAIMILLITGAFGVNLKQVFKKRKEGSEK